MIVMTESKTFYFRFDQPKNGDENLKHPHDFIIKSNEYLAENKIKSKTEQLFSKYKYEKNIHEHKKQQNE